MRPSAKVGLERFCILGVSALILFVACETEDPTGVSGRPSHIIRGSGCSPLVIETSSNVADTTLVTFDDPNNAGALCGNLVPWGIDIADPVGVDTPQGNGHFTPVSSPSANVPSPPSWALGAFYSPPQVMIEVDPPISSAEFMYSRIALQPGKVNGQPGLPDGVWVYARSRTPGTLNYQTYDSKLLPSTQPNSSPPSWNVWAPARLSASGDLIQWLWFDGAIGIDNLRIVRTGLSCTPSTVVRGQTVSCVVPNPTYSVTKWEFREDGGGVAMATSTTSRSADDGLALMTAANEPPSTPATTVWVSSSKVWTGPALVGGLVTVYITDRNGASRTYSTTLSVLDRNWNWPGTWKWDRGDTIVPPRPTVPDHEPFATTPADTDKAGQNCPFQSCLLPSRVQPEPRDSLEAGVTIAQATQGVAMPQWYIKDIRYNMKRLANVNPGITKLSPRKHPVPLAGAPKKCRQGLGAGPKDTSKDANWWSLNNYCGGDPTLLNGRNMDDWVAAVWAHEGSAEMGERVTSHSRKPRLASQAAIRIRQLNSSRMRTPSISRTGSA